MNWYPMYFGTGGKILFWASDSKELHLRLKLNLWTYNYVGTIFGGSMFAASDPFYMLMLHSCLGSDYVVWDKAANIKFRRPGKETLYCKFLLTDELIEDIRLRVAEKKETEHTFILQWVNAEGKVYSEIERLCYVADKKHYEVKRGATQSAKLGRI